MKAATVETVPDDEEDARPKSKRNQKKGRDSSSSQKLDSKAGGKKESVKAQEGNNFIPPDEWVMKKIVDSVPEFEDEGTSEKIFLCAFIQNHVAIVHVTVAMLFLQVWRTQIQFSSI